MRPLQEFLLSLSFFTRLPLSKTDLSKVNLADSAWSFPIVGAVIGAFGATSYILFTWLGISYTISAWLAVFLQIILTGGLHEDGLADTADALASGRSLEKRLEIMRDSRIGSYGTIALIIALSLRANAIAAIPQAVIALFIISGAVSRGFIALLMRTLPAAQETGLAKMAGRPSLQKTTAALLFSLLFMLLFAGFTLSVKLLIVATTASFILYLLSKKYFFGATGDTLGASQQIIEILLLVMLSTQK